jgi:predicted Holliday junction resolvase-like endonuclease
MFLTELIVVLICLFALGLFLITVYVKFKIIDYLNKSIYSRVASLHKTNRQHERWINTLSEKMDSLEITGKVRKIDNEVVKKSIRKPK